MVGDEKDMVLMRERKGERGSQGRGREENECNHLGGGDGER